MQSFWHACAMPDTLSVRAGSLVYSAVCEGLLTVRGALLLAGLALLAGSVLVIFSVEAAGRLQLARRAPLLALATADGCSSAARSWVPRSPPRSAECSSSGLSRPAWRRRRCEVMKHTYKLCSVQSAVGSPHSYRCEVQHSALGHMHHAKA